MDINTLLTEAERLGDSLLADRRTLHQHPETGAVLPETTAYVSRRLMEMGYAPQTLAGGVTVEITGTDTGRCVLLRADMDALPIRERSGLAFQSENGNMHACGHDLHTAMLLGAAQLLRQHQHELQGTVRLVFQPDEEGFTGAKAMLVAGVLESAPKPEAGFALHVASGTPTGLAVCGRGAFMAGCTLFRITVRGVGCHGAMPETGVDPLNIAAHIYLSIQTLTARELPAKTPAVITIGSVHGGKAPNILPGEVVMEGTIRTFDQSVTAKLMERITAIASATAEGFRGSAFVEELASAPPLENDPALTDRAADWAEALLGAEHVCRTDEGGMGSEDFAAFSCELPCAYLLLGAGTEAEYPRFGRPMHNDAVVFNEAVLPGGAALYAACALRYLAEQDANV